MCYLTGFESIWYPPRAPLGARRHPRLDERSSSSTTSATARSSRCRRTSTRRSSSPTRRRVATVADAFADRGWTDGTVGIEWHIEVTGRTADRGRSPTCSPIGAPGSSTATGSSTASGSSSRPREIECVRRAAGDGGRGVPGDAGRGEGRDDGDPDRGAAQRDHGRSAAARSRRSARWSRPGRTSGVGRTAPRPAGRSSAVT